mgnify:CR=1 FL=1
MKLNRILFAALIASITGSSITSCSESFLDENLTTQYSTDRFKTQEGLDELVTGAYQKLKFKFNYIWGIQCYNMGVDEFTDANNVIPAWNHYSQDLNSSENAANQPIWDNYYGLVEPANILIQNIPQYYNQSSPTYNTRLGEAHFLRAYAYFELVKQFGGVPLKLVPSTSAETYFTRNSAEEIYTQVISDFGEAYRLLPDKGESIGRINKYAAARKAQKEGGWKSKTAKLTDEEKLLRDALRPKFGKALSKSAVAQRIAANPKSAALRKTSKNNPINKAKRAAHRKNRNHEGDE